MRRFLLILLLCLIFVDASYSFTGGEAVAAAIVAVGIWPYLGVETLNSSIDQSITGMVGWGLGEVGWVPGSTNTDWSLLPFTVTSGPFGIKTTLIEGYAWRKGAEYYSLLPLYLYLDPLYKQKKIGKQNILNVIAYHPYLYIGGSKWVQDNWQNPIIRNNSIRNDSIQKPKQSFQTILEAGIGFSVSGLANVQLSYRKSSWSKIAETSIRLNWPLSVWSGYGIKPIEDKKPSSNLMAKIEPMVQKIKQPKNGIDMVSASEPQLMPKPVASLSWDTGEIKAGSQARLHLDIENQGKGDLYRFVAETDSRLSMFDQKRLEFGRIPPNQSRTLTFTFETNSEAISQEVPILVRFEEHNDYVPDAINTKLYLRAEDRPKFDFSYRVVDGGTESSVGNGDGIIPSTWY